TVSSSSSGGASLWSTSSTSYWPGVGSGGSSRGYTRNPGTWDTAPNTSPYISSVERSRSCQSFVTMPPKPPQAATPDHIAAASGKAVTASTTWSDARFTASSDASG